MAEMFKEDFSKRFVNPYNFIPLMGKCERSVPELNDSGYTGYFDCRIKLLTPLFIPNTSSCSRLLTDSEKSDECCQKERWKGYDFFSYHDWSNEAVCKRWPPLPESPVIPGSELKGAVRSVYEAAFNGCMSSVSLNRVLSRRTNEAKKPGILKKVNGAWVIYPCKKAMLFVKNQKMNNPGKAMGIPVPKNEYAQWKEGQELWIKLRKESFETKIGSKRIPIGKVIEEYEIIQDSNVTDCNSKKQDKRNELSKKGYIQGWLHKGEGAAFSRKHHEKHHESVFYDCDTSEEHTVRVEHCSDIVGLEKILEEYRDPKKNRKLDKTGNWYSGYQVSPEGTLVYYSNDAGGHVYLSPACIGREVFTQTIEKLLENNGDYKPCTGPELCSACQIFGMVGRNGTYAFGSKVRVTDAVLIHPVQDIEKLFEKPIILPELGEPKPGAVEFYTKPPYTMIEAQKSGKGFWTYDYKHMIRGGKITIEKKHLDEKQPELRGRKFYWHSNVELEKYREMPGNRLSAMKQRIRPMKAGNPDAEPLFCFRLYFERMSKKQLNELKWTLDFGNKDCAHKIGRAKPLGFGSIQIIVDALYLREIDGLTGSWTIEKQDLKQFFVKPVKSNQAMETVLKMANWKERPDHVRYPSVEVEVEDNGNKPNSAASHQWFTNNKGKISNPNFYKVLPKAEEDARKDLESSKALYTVV